jgi:hypothetical protein
MLHHMLVMTIEEVIAVEFEIIAEDLAQPMQYTPQRTTRPAVQDSSIAPGPIARRY